ncbi:hypothetical protein [Actinoplanes sp. NBRC 101535]|uniref:hypothetical protein n=1 Tax=Actinoplanes sp. NBRC 101535 TaxID=3032196 RepID=UPI0024A58BCE|nr:hypothetical protein [Actinoplanes sp. NBRC 101535]GLY08262.1 hypothetical protein Acsp01_86410 [Actinoplanes sp. NBRC 101535]
MLHTAGRDFVCGALGDASGSRPAAAQYIALTANNTSPSAGDTTLTGEITTAGGGLVRAVGTYAHTTGAATYTLTKTFTGNGSDSYPVTVNKVAVLNASSSGTMVYSSLLSPSATFSASGDNTTITVTVTVS